MQKNIPFKQPGTGSANPGVHSDLSVSNVNIVRVISNVSFRTTGDIAYCCQRFAMN